MSTWDHVSSRLGNVKSETKSIAEEIYDAAEAAGHEIWFMWGMGTSTEHRTGLALDLMVRNKAGGDWIRNYIWANRARLRLRHVIWWQAITSTVVRPGVRRQMADRGSVTQNHKDHIHVLFIAGDYRAPSGGTRADHVKRIQRALGVEADGMWGPVTDGRAMTMRGAGRSRRGWPSNQPASFNTREVQRVVGTLVDGIWGPNSQSALANWVVRFQHILNVRGDGLWGPKTDGKFLSVRRRYLNNW